MWDFLNLQGQVKRNGQIVNEPLSTPWFYATGRPISDAYWARVKINGKPVKISRKRFYLFRGGLDSNKDRVARLKAANFTSRDCYYCNLHTSKEYIAWLKEKGLQPTAIQTPGMHAWMVWRDNLTNFAPLLFQSKSPNRRE